MNNKKWIALILIGVLLLVISNYTNNVSAIDGTFGNKATFFNEFNLSFTTVTPSYYQIACEKITGPYNSVIESITARVKVKSTPISFRCAVYDLTSNLIAQTSSISVTSTSYVWKQFNFTYAGNSIPYVQSSGIYYICCMAQQVGVGSSTWFSRIQTNNLSSETTCYYRTYYESSSFPTSVSFSAYSGHAFDIYASYTCINPNNFSQPILTRTNIIGCGIVTSQYRWNYSTNIMMMWSNATFPSIKMRNNTDNHVNINHHQRYNASTNVLMDWNNDTRILPNFLFIENGNGLFILTNQNRFNASTDTEIGWVNITKATIDMRNNTGSHVTVNHHQRYNTSTNVLMDWNNDTAWGISGSIYNIHLNLLNLLGFKNWSGSYNSLNSNISFNVTSNMTLTCNGNSSNITYWYGSTVTLGLDTFMFLLIYLFAILFFMFNNKTNELFINSGVSMIFSFFTILLIAGIWVGSYINYINIDILQKAMLTPFFFVFLGTLYLFRINRNK